MANSTTGPCEEQPARLWLPAPVRAQLESQAIENGLHLWRDCSRLAQMRWKTSVPRALATRPFGARYVAIPLVATVVGPTKRPDQTVVALQSVVQFLEVWNTTREPRTRPIRS